ncbi:hypothetical protein EAF00_001954 [Botryotinia globosa]|nr:hypothetical protein EAF00_001954 [Botryotinia globosa]
MPLLALSNELLHAIIEFCEFSGVRELCKTCHQLNTVATPHLYSTITFYDNTEDACPKDPSHYHFLRTIVHRPDLAKFPRIFHCVWLLRAHLESTRRLFCRNIDDRSDPATSLRDLIRIKINEASASKEHAKLWQAAIFGLGDSRAPGSDGIMALIVCLLPNLKEIHMSEGNFKRGGDVGTIIDPTAEFFAPMFAHAVALQTKQRESENEISPYSMSKLASMSIKNLSRANIPLSKVLHRLELPSLKKFVAQHAIDPPNGIPISIPETFTSGVQDLRFERSSFDSENLRRLLSACPSLCRFALEYSSRIPFCSTEMVAGLMASKETLKFIEARMASEFIRPHFILTGSFGRPGSFADFPRLKEIVATAGVILDDSTNKNTSAEKRSDEDTDADHIRSFLQRIPRSLQRLTLKDCYAFDSTTFAAVLALVREKERYAPNLKYISLTWLGIHPSEYRPSKYDLINACKEGGIELALRFKHYYFR